MPKTFIVSDESINSYGFRVLTSGIQLGNFKKNPVLFFNHDTCGWTNESSDYNGPLGRWDNLKVVDSQLMADPVMDINDPKGKAINDKIENDFIRAASIGFRILKTSEDPADMLPGQSYPTVTKCDLVEISIVDLPANKNALCCFDAEGNKIDLGNVESITTTLSALLPKKVVGTETNNGKGTKTNSNDNKETNTLNIHTMKKLTLKSAWTALVSWAAVTFGEGVTETEVEISAEQLADLNMKLTRLNELETSNTELTALVNSLKADLNDANGNVSALNLQLEAARAENAALKKVETAPEKPVNKGADASLTDGSEKEELDSITLQAIENTKKFGNVKS